MEEVFVARKPVFDGRKEVYGYALLFRAGFEDYYGRLDVYDVVDDKAKVDLMAFVNFGELTDGKRGFVTFDRSLLLRDFPSLLPSNMMTVGLPPGLMADDEVVARCKGLKASGSVLALDDFTLQRRDDPLLELVDLVKVDFRKTAEEDRRKICQTMAQEGVMALAMNIETADEFTRALEWGYAYFEGDFFSKPDVKPDKEIAANKLIYLQVLNEVNRPDLSFDELEALIKQDVSMTYKLLQFMNSVWFGLRYEVHSIKHALVLLGPKEVKKWASLLAIGHTGADKPRELLLRSLTRAKVGEQLAPLVAMPGSASELFLMGMFSVIDALMDRPIAELLEDLPLNEEVKATLLGESSRFRVVYDLILAYEEGQWDLFSSYAGSLDLDESVIPELFRNSSKWANNALEVM